MEPVSYVGKIVEYQGSSGLKMGLATGAAKGRLQVLDRNGRNETVSAGKVLFSHDYSQGPAGFAAAALELDRRIGDEVAQIELEFLWESVRGEGEGCFTVEDLATLYFGEVSPEKASAVFRAVSSDDLHFKMRALQVYPRSEGEVNAHLDALERQKERSRLRQEAVDSLQRVLQGEDLRLPEELSGVVRALEDYLFRGAVTEAEAWLRDVQPAEDPRETCFRVLHRLGRISPEADRFLLIAGIQASFSQKALVAAEGLKPYEPAEGRLDLTRQAAFAIDDEETEEIDDAFTVEQADEGFRLGIHIADVSHFVRAGDALFEEALLRRTSLYLPHNRVPMLPGVLSTALASLNSSGVKPTISFLVDFDQDGAVRSWSVHSAQVRVVHHWTYDEVEKTLHAGNGAFASSLSLLEEISRKLAALREANGAVNLRRPDLKVRASGDEIQVELVQTDTASRRIVSEFMILANQLAAQYAFLREIPVIYRVQGPPRQAVRVPEQYDPVAYDRIFRQLEKSRFSLSRQPHSGLGLAGYTQLTSPIRRLGDLVIQQQISAHLSGRPVPFEQEELLKALVQAEAGEQAARAVERRAQRYYLYRYFKEHLSDIPLEAVVVMRLDRGYLVETVDHLTRGRLHTDRHLELGAKLSVVLGRADPEKEVLIFALR